MTSACTIDDFLYVYHKNVHRAKESKKRVLEVIKEKETQ